MCANCCSTTASTPIVIGKKDEQGDHLFPAYGTLEPNQIAIAIGERILARKHWPEVAERLAAIRTCRASLSNAPDLAARMPYFCAGCPHNSSTVLPGGRARLCRHRLPLDGAVHAERATPRAATQMGGEGANWIGEAPFSKRKHVFQNLGDGTYNHSGLLAHPRRARLRASTSPTRSFTTTRSP